jgi:hypothetical protein
MSLVSVRKQFAIYSGRYDLIVDRVTFADKGADFFIQSGQRYLDRTFDIFKAESRFYTELAAGSWYVLAPDCRVVDNVYLSNSTGARAELRRISLTEYKRIFRSDPMLAAQSADCIGTYCVSNLRVTPQIPVTITIDRWETATYNTTGLENNFTGILISPSTTGDTTCEIYGKFYQPRLLVDNDTNIWSEQYEVVLVMAACRELEISYRNTVGVKDWEVAITSELHGVELDDADQESNYITKFRG